jgi:flavin-dependent dehydrogenase
MAKRIKTDVLVIGGGPAGAAASIHLRERGVTPLIVERERFPRFHIGESMTGECGNLVRELGFEAEMQRQQWPVKHGVVVTGTKGNTDWWIPMMGRNPDLTAHFNPTWQVRRATFDAMLLDAARDRGADFLAARARTPVVDDAGKLVGVEVETDDGDEVRIEADITLDCSGQATFLANKRVTGPKYLGSYDKQIAIFSHVTGFARDEETDDARVKATNTHIFYTRKYHWAWAIPIDHETQSIGIVVPAAYFREKKESRRDFYVRELRELNPGLAARTTDVELVEDVHVIPNYSFQARGFADHGFICVGDAHRFVDPIFSFGLYVALKESGLAADAAVAYLDGKGRDDAKPFHEYMVMVEKGIDVLEDMIDTFWENPLAFSVMVHNRYREPMIDVFSGRIYEDSLHKGRDEAMVAFRKLLKRERTYDDEGMFSVPIGSRFHEERAPLWNAELDSVETTERWIRQNV